MPSSDFHNEKAAAFNAVASLIHSLSKDNIHRDQCEQELLALWERIDLARDWEVVQHRLPYWVDPEEGSHA